MGTFGTLLIALLAVAAAGTGAQAAVDQREMKAREAFAVGKYQEALDLFAKLYAEKLHPNYLRNIGRCYQNLGEPDQAINSFREYLRKAKTVSADERQEVEGYIKEMEDLRAKQQATATPPPPPNPTGTTGATGTPATTGTAATTTSATTTPDLNATNPTTTTTTTTTTAAGADLNGGAPSSGGDGDSPIYGRWWFWAIVVGVIGAGVGVAAAAGAFTKTENASCPEGSRC